jgi:hypothetical protein
MSEVLLVRRRIEPGKTERLRAWYDELEEREREVVETLDHESVYTETAFVEETGNGDFLYGYMEAADLDAASEAADEEIYDVDREHHEVLAECLTGERTVLDPIGHFTHRDRP